MPNWIEGTMKVRGKADNLIRFMDEAFDAAMKKYEWEDCVDYGIPAGAYIRGSRRAFTRDEGNGNIDKAENEDQVITLPIKQAWSFSPAVGEELRWVRLAEEYGVDIRLQGFERGMEFYQDLAIVGGRITIDKVVEYDDWAWDCPMPNLGG